jgi:hypothetical protein
MVAEGDPKARIFISYSRRDLAFADRLDAALRERGFATLIDRADIHAFEDWEKRIKELIVAADTVVFVISPDAIASKVCADEIAFADQLSKRFAPIVLRRVDDEKIPAELARLNFIFFDDGDAFEQDTDRLAEALTSDIG